MNHLAITFAVVAMLGWGVWAVLANVATRSIAPEVAMILSYVTSVAIAVGYVAVQNDPISLDRTGVGYALAAGVFAGVGGVAFYAGLSQGRTSIVTTVSALYFVVAAVIGIAVLSDSLTLREAAGILFAVVSVALLAG